MAAQDGDGVRFQIAARVGMMQCDVEVVDGKNRAGDNVW